MARRSTQKSEFNILLPSLALSALVFLLAIAVATGVRQPQQVVVSADNDTYLSESDDIESLENDLLLLESDNLLEEQTILQNIQ